MVTTMAEIELNVKWAVIGLPEDTVEVEITAKVYMNGEIVKVGKTLNMKELREAFQEAEDGYIPSEAMFQLTDEWRKYLEGLLNG